MTARLHDLRYALRMLAKSPGFTAVAVLTLALGIGANTAIYSVVRAVLLKPLPYPSADQLMFLREYQLGGSDMSVNWLNFLDWRNQARAFDGMAAYDVAHFTLTGAGEPELLRGGNVSASFFSVLDAKPLLGRVFTQSDDRPDAAPTVVLSYGLWQRRFSGDIAIVGKTIDLSGAAYTAVGVMPSDFSDPIRDQGIDLYIPVGLESRRWTARDERGSLAVLARLQPQSSLAAARVEMDTIERQLELENSKTNKGIRASITPLYELRFGDLRPSLFALLGAVSLVLLIACANVANLLLARATGRGKEIAIRQAVGAGRAVVIRQLLVESVMLSCLGGALGLFLAWWSIGLLIRVAPPGVPRLANTQLDGGVLIFTLLVSIISGIVFGLAPAIQSSRVDLIHALKEGGGGAIRGLPHQRLRSTLLVVEVATAMLVVVGSGLLIRSLLKAQRVNPGFNPDHVLIMELVFPDKKYDTPQKLLAFEAEALDRLRALPGVSSAGEVLCPPAVGHCWDWFYEVEGHPSISSSALPVSAFNQAGPGYFTTMQIPLLAGRYFNEHDGAQSPRVVIVNQTFARRWWPTESPLGKRIKLWSAKGENPYQQIVGMVDDVKEDGVDAEQIPEVFMPLAQQSSGAVTFAMRTEVEPTSLSAAASRAVHELDKDLPIQRIQPMTEYITNSLAQRRFSTFLLAVFAGLALLLAAVGIYGVIAYSVAQRTHEMGLRMALGARRRDVLKLVIAQGMILTIFGVGIGLAAAIAFSRFLSSLLFGVGATDPITLVTVSAVLALVSLGATYLPARRATKVDPMVALRYE